MAEINTGNNILALFREITALREAMARVEEKIDHVTADKNKRLGRLEKAVALMALATAGCLGADKLANLI